jgi:hypothetical protein
VYIIDLFIIPEGGTNFKVPAFPFNNTWLEKFDVLHFGSVKVP